MLLEGAPSTAILNVLRDDLHNDEKWLELVHSQQSPTLRLEILERAVATVPSSLKLWRALVRDLATQSTQASLEKLQESLKHTLSLFPDQRDLWELLMLRFPGVDSFTTALRYVDNTEVWPVYLEFLLNPHTALSDDEVFDGLRHFLEFDPSKLNDVLHSAWAVHRVGAVEKLLLLSRASNFELWAPIIERTTNSELLMVALELFPMHDGEIVPKLLQVLVEHEGRFVDGRRLMLTSLENISSVAAFPAIFRAASAIYEFQIGQAFRGIVKGEFATAKILAEFGNLLRKRPMFLSDTATRAFPNSIDLWLHRAELWKNRPHIAADVLETALKTVNPIIAAESYGEGKSDMSDLYIRYAELMVANGCAVNTIQTILEEAIVKPYMTINMRAKLYTAMANLIKEIEPQNSIVALETALQLPNLESKQKQELWLQYFHVLIDTMGSDGEAKENDNKNTEKLLAAFSRACITREVTMRMCLMVSQAFPVASANQSTIFDQAVELFPVPMVLPLWKRYLVALNDVSSPSRLRGLYSQALNSFQHNKQGYEELVLLYYEAEKSWATGSMVLARQRLVHTLHRTVNPRIWQVYIATLNDVTSLREAYEEAINKVSPEYAHQLALEFAAMELEQGQPTRANQIYEFARQMEQQFKSRDDQMVEKSRPEILFVPAMT